MAKQVKLQDKRRTTMKRIFSFPVEDTSFKKSTFSDGRPYRCVKVAIRPEGIAVRDTKDSNKKTLFFKKNEWSAFVKGVKNGEFDI